MKIKIIKVLLFCSILLNIVFIIFCFVKNSDEVDVSQIEFPISYQELALHLHYS